LNKCLFLSALPPLEGITVVEVVPSMPLLLTVVCFVVVVEWTTVGSTVLVYVVYVVLVVDVPSLEVMMV